MAGKTRVVVTGGNHRGALAAVRALHAAGYDAWVAASSRGAYGARSHAAAGAIIVPDSGDDPEGFIARLGSAAEELRIGSVIGGTERDLLAIARFRDRLGALADGAPELDALLRATDKSTIYRLALQAGLRVPETTELSSLSALAGERMNMPVMIKPVRSELEGSDGQLVGSACRRVSTGRELSDLAQSLPTEHWVIQTCVEGRLGAVCGVAWNGEVVTTVHQIAERVWPPKVGVSSYARTVPRDPALQDGVARLTGLLGWSGIFQAQFIHTEDGPYLIDFNPRIYGSLALATAAGANLPAIYVALMSGLPAETPGYRVGVRYRSEELDIRSLLHLMRSGRPVAASLGLIPRRNTVHAVASVADPRPMLTSIQKLRQQGVKKLIKS